MQLDTLCHSFMRETLKDRFDTPQKSQLPQQWTDSSAALLLPCLLPDLGNHVTTVHSVDPRTNLLSVQAWVSAAGAAGQPPAKLGAQRGTNGCQKGPQAARA